MTRAHTKTLSFRNPAIVFVTIVMLMTVPWAAAQKGKDKKKDVVAEVKPQVDTSKLVWPPAPDVTRVKWLQAISGELDLNPEVAKTKKKSSWMDRMAGVQLPAEQGKPRLYKPYGIASDSKGIVYVADIQQARLFAFDLENKKVMSRGGEAFSAPAGLAVDDLDRLFVTDANLHTVFCLRPDGSLEGTFGERQLGRPIGVAVDNENRFVYVVDALNHRLAIFDADTFKFLRYLGKQSEPPELAPGTFETPTNVAVDSESNVYVVDTFNARVQVFNADGEFLRMFGKQGNTPGTFMRPKGIAIDRDDHVYIVDSEFNNVQVFDTEGRILMFFGERGDGPGTFTLAAGVAVDQNDRILVTEQWNGRFQVFRYVPDKDAAAEYEKVKKAEDEQKKAEQAAAKVSSANGGAKKE